MLEPADGLGWARRFNLYIDISLLSGRIEDPSLYLDFGSGFSEAPEARVKFPKRLGNLLVFTVSAAAEIHAVRFDPSETFCKFAIVGALISTRGLRQAAARAQPMTRTRPRWASFLKARAPAGEPLLALPPLGEAAKGMIGLSRPGQDAEAGMGGDAVATASDLTFEQPERFGDLSYAEWCRQNEPHGARSPVDRQIAGEFAFRPTVSFIVPVYRISKKFVSDLVESVKAQSYTKWELCFALAYRDDKGLEDLLVEQAASSPQIKLALLGENGGISRNSNAALELATGEFVALLDHDDIIPPWALFEMVKALQQSPDVDFVYSDKDMIDESGATRINPLFKPDWSPDAMLSANYLTHFNLMRTGLVREIGGWDPDTDGAQDWDIFLRVIARSRKVAHVSQPLYHWRLVQSSVSAGGLAAKPYAAKAQLRAVEKYARASGWPNARTAFGGDGEIVVAWRDGAAPMSLPSATVVILNGNDASERFVKAWTRYDGPIRFVSVDCRSNPGALDALLAAIETVHVVMIDADIAPRDAGWLGELVGPLENRAIALVGAQVTSAGGEIVDSGIVFQDGIASPIFRSRPWRYYGISGSSAWIANYAAVSGKAIAFRKSDYDLVGRFANPALHHRPDVSFCLALTDSDCGRVMLNPRCLLTAMGPSYFENSYCNPVAAAQDRQRMKLRFGAQDPYLNKNLLIDSCGAPQFRLRLEGQSTGQGPHNYSAEAAYFAENFDFSSSDISGPCTAGRRDAPGSGAIRSVVWFVPQFANPYYGGIMTILRAADYMSRMHGVRQRFAVLGEADETAVRLNIARAFPSLSQACDVFPMPDPNTLPAIPDSDAGICTLWTTALPLRRAENIGRKYYMVQDFEPLFYPSGSMSALVEATYRFGFHGICNTEPLARLYREFGGSASHFVPAVDRSVFHPGAKHAAADATVYFVYARPGHPRNCFEAIAAGLREFDRRVGRKARILTAGADWDVASHGLDGVVQHLGLLEYAQTGSLYRLADVGLVAMATAHPSYLPLELMACGTAVLTNVNRHTSWLLAHDKNAVLCEMTKSDIADNLERLMDPALRTRLRAEGFETIAKGHSDWEAVCQAIYDAVSSLGARP